MADTWLTLGLYWDYTGIILGLYWDYLWPTYGPINIEQDIGIPIEI
jgi:hypothetical protein